MPPRKTTAKRDKPSTKERLLRTAISLFSSKGFDGVSVNDIVSQAKVNKRMVYHYFSNKALLYQEALTYAYDGLSEFERETIGEALALDDIVKRLIEVYFEFPRLHPEFTQLMLWENLNKGQGIRGAKSGLSKGTVVSRLQAAIKRDADGIHWRKDLEATNLLITIIGICQVYASHRYTLSQGLHVDLASPAIIKKGKATAEHYMLAGMRPDPKTPKIKSKTR
jgi:AcrR family transcriptional regulator